jgi:SAM-dependent methyltransferase
MADAGFDGRLPEEKKSVLDSPERYEEISPDRLLASLGLKPGDRVVDIGCGTGFFTVPAAKLVAPTGYVLGLDSAPQMLASLEARARAENLANIGVVQADCCDTTLPNASADAVILGVILHEVPDRVGLLRECRRLLKTDGRILVIEFDRIEHPGPGPLTGYGPPLQARIAKEDLPALARQAGLAQERVIEVPPVTYAAVLKLAQE